MITGPLKWYTVAETLRQAVHAELTVKPARSGVVPGAIAWDECDCGILAVSISQVYPSETFPDQQTLKVGRCDAPWEVAEITVQIVRCAPNPEGQELSPSVAALDASAREVARDAYETLRAVSVTLCQMDDARDIADFMIRTQTAQGPTGGCVGSELRAAVSLPRN